MDAATKQKAQRDKGPRKERRPPDREITAIAKIQRELDSLPPEQVERVARYCWSRVEDRLPKSTATNAPELTPETPA